LKGKLAVGYAQLAACSNSDGASLSPEYRYGMQSEMPSLTSNSNSSSPYDQQYLNPWGHPQLIRSDNVAIDSYIEEVSEEEGSWNDFSVCMQGGNHPLPTAQETNVFQDAETLSELRHPHNNQDGYLEDLVSAILRRNRSTCPTTEFFE
jgi:hypothetical protein